MPAWVMMLSKVKHQLSDAVPFAHGQSAFRACVLPPVTETLWDACKQQGSHQELGSNLALPLRGPVPPHYASGPHL